MTMDQYIAVRESIALAYRLQDGGRSDRLTQVIKAAEHMHSKEARPPFRRMLQRFAEVLMEDVEVDQEEL